MNNEEVRKARAWSLPVVGFAGLGVVGLNYIWAHYREVMSTAEVFSEGEVVRHIVEAPLSLSLTSSVLMVGGVLCGVLAARKAYTSTDRFPGYEAVDRKFRDAEDAKDDLKNAIEGQLDAIRAVDVDGLAERLEAERGMLEDIRRRYSALQVACTNAHRLDCADVEAGAAVIEHYAAVREQVGGQLPKALAEPQRFDELIPEATHADLAGLIEEVAGLQRQAAEGLVDMVAQERQRIAVAKENTEAIMLSVERRGSEGVEVLRPEDVKALLDIEGEAVMRKPRGVAEESGS